VHAGFSATSDGSVDYSVSSGAFGAESHENGGLRSLTKFFSDVGFAQKIKTLPQRNTDNTDLNSKWFY
jgi:hypothetical protein